MTPAPCDLPAVLDELTAAVRDVMARRAIPLDETGVRNSLVSPIRAAMIRDEYNRERERGVKSEAILIDIAERYNISYWHVYNITHGRR